MKQRCQCLKLCLKMHEYKMYQFTKELFTAPKPASPFIPVSTEQVLSDLAVSRQQRSEGKGVDAREALQEVGRQRGFVLETYDIANGEVLYEVC